MARKNANKEQLTYYTIILEDYEYYYHFGKNVMPHIFPEEYDDLDESNSITIQGFLAKDSDDRKVPKGYRVEFEIRPSYVFGKHNTEIEYWGYGERSRNTKTLQLSMIIPKDSFSNILSMLVANKIKFISVNALSLKYNKTKVRSFSLHSNLDPEDY